MPENQGTINGAPKTKIAIDEFSFQLLVGPYTANADILAAAVTAG